MEATATKVNLKTEALKNGAIWGVINIVLFAVVWYGMPSLMSSYVYVGITVVIGILLAVFFCIDLRKKAGGYWSFSEALWPILAMFLTNMTIVLVFTLVFGKVIDPTYPVKMKEVSMAGTEKMMSSMGMDESQLQEAMAKTEERLDKQFNPSVGDFIFQYGMSAVFYFIGALIFAAIFKKANPNPWSEQEEEPVLQE
ncbi:DUF4199 domain-containing protein [Pedobacter sp. Du54]|uniref:DUF4199 domain-containing protein n=1 Tax=Pedobacter anseongensis TaxID=3133439 RepID=UPI0030B33F1D